jgi:hypothetical protein
MPQAIFVTSHLYSYAIMYTIVYAQNCHAETSLRRVGWLANARHPASRMHQTIQALEQAKRSESHSNRTAWELEISDAPRSGEGRMIRAMPNYTYVRSIR